MKRFAAVFMIALAIAFAIEAFVTLRDFAPIPVVVLTVAVQIVGVLCSLGVALVCIRNIRRAPQ